MILIYIPNKSLEYIKNEPIEVFLGQFNNEISNIGKLYIINRESAIESLKSLDLQINEFLQEFSHEPSKEDFHLVARIFFKASDVHIKLAEYAQDLKSYNDEAIRLQYSLKSFFKCNVKELDFKKQIMCKLEDIYKNILENSIHIYGDRKLSDEYKKEVQIFLGREIDRISNAEA